MRQRSTAVRMGFIGLLAFTVILSGCDSLVGGGDDNTTYTITYDANGADSGSEPSDQTKTGGSDLTLSSNSGNLTRDGFTFAGWNTASDGSGTSYAAGGTYSADADLTLYAEWAENYTVSYDANGAESGSAPSDQTETEGSNSTLSSNSGNLTRDGFTFAGWNTASDGSGTSYAEGATYSGDADVTLYAEWAETYTVTYDANGAESGSAPSDQTKTEESDLTLASNTGELDIVGYQSFAGWNTASDGTGTSYAAGATYTADADLTLYAQWSAIGETGEAGGIIFYDDEADGEDDIAGARYLEAAPASTQWDTKEWGGEGTDVNGNDDSVAPGLYGIGDGETSTQAIVDALGSGDYAAKLCSELEHGGYEDWFLPSRDELDLMYQNKGVIAGFSFDVYWSSSEGSATNAWNQDFSNGNQSSDAKSYGYRVRAVRAY